MYETIVVPTDGSGHSIRAAEHGQYLAGLFDATVHVVSAVDVESAGGLFSAGGVDEAFVDRLDAQAEDAIESTTAVLDPSTAVTTAVVRGKPTQAILDYADEHDADLLAMGTHGRTGLNRYIAGSVTENVVRLASRPVVTVRETERSHLDGDYDEILLPTDGSDPAEAAVDHALAVAERSGARVHAVNVVDVGDIATTPNYSPPTDMLDHMEAEGQRATDAVAERAGDTGVEVVTEVLDGFPGPELLDYVDDNEIDLVAMGTHGRSGLDRILLGSTAERLIRQSQVPVMAVSTRGRE